MYYILVESDLVMTAQDVIEGKDSFLRGSVPQDDDSMHEIEVFGAFEALHTYSLWVAMDSKKGVTKLALNHAIRILMPGEPKQIST